MVHVVSACLYSQAKESPEKPPPIYIDVAAVLNYFS